jgi:large subunit ribosomal protein L25
MAHETPTIKAAPRTTSGSRDSRQLREAGRLPGVIYGHKTDPVSVSLDEDEILQHVSHGTHVIEVAVDGGKTETCLVKDLQFGYLGDNVIHVDFARVNLDEEVTVHVHINYTGEPEMAKKPGAILSQDLTELTVRCKVNAIPDEIKVDLRPFEGNVMVGDIELPPGVVATHDPATPIVHVSFVHKEEAAGEEVQVEGGAEPEVITESKDEGESKDDK